MNSSPVPPGPRAGESGARAEGRSPTVVVLAVGLGLVLAIGLRLALMPARGNVTDVDEFVRWIGAIARGDLGRAYDIGLSYPPMMIYLFDALGTLVPGFRTAADGSDLGLRLVLKTPALIADLAMAGGVGYLLRARTRWALAAGFGVLLMPPVWYLSAWWGQFDSIYVLLGLLAAASAISARHRWAAVLLALALMTKPQALAFVIPLAAFWLGLLGWRRSVPLAAIGVGVIVLVWLPFLGSGGPATYLDSVRNYQDETFAVLSALAWNVWWPLQQAVAGSGFYSDRVAMAGPLTARLLGLIGAAGALALVARSIHRRPTPETLLLGMAASVLVAYTFMTAMHERYVYGAIVLLAPLIPDRRVLVLWLAVGATAALNLLAAAPPSEAIAHWVTLVGPLSVLASITMVGVTVVAVALLMRWSLDPAGPPAILEAAEAAPKGSTLGLAGSPTM